MTEVRSKDTVSGCRMVDLAFEANGYQRRMLMTMEEAMELSYRLNRYLHETRGERDGEEG